MLYSEEEIKIQNETNLNLLEEYSNNENKKVKFSLALNKNCTSEILEKIYNIDSKALKLFVVRNPNCPVYIIEDIFNHFGDQLVIHKRDVLKNPNCPASILENYLNSNDIRYRTALSLNKNITSLC